MIISSESSQTPLPTENNLTEAGTSPHISGGKVGRMAAVGDRYPLKGMFVLSSDKSDLVQIAQGMGREDSFPSLSVDGAHVVFGSRDGEIYLTDIESGQVVNLTNRPALDGHPKWSPDGKRIAFESNRAGSVDLFIMEADGSGVFNVTRSESDEVLGGWSPDGSKIIFTSLLVPSAPEGVPVAPFYSIRLADLTSGSMMTLFDEGRDGITMPILPTFSPSGDKIAFQGVANGQQAIFIWV